MNINKICTSCSTEKQLNEFPKNTKGKHGHGNKCLECSREYAKSDRKKNPLKRLSQKYKIGLLDQTAALYYAEECEICHKTSVEVKLVVDHNHTTGKVRGKICDLCNKGLGQFQDNQQRMLDAVLYLRKYNV